MTRPTASTWHAERYAAGERLAKATLSLLQLMPEDLMMPAAARAACTEASFALAEYDRTRDHP